MVFTHALSPAEVQKALSAARLSSYETLIGTTNLDQSIGAYIWGLELNAALSSLLSMIEVLLRNSLHSAATREFGKPDWYSDVLKYQGDKIWAHKVSADPLLAQHYYRRNVAPHNKKKIYVGSTQRTLKHWRSPSEARIEEIFGRLHQDGKPNSPDQVVAHAMFGFWLTLFEATFESATDRFALWPKCLRAVFPHHATITRAQVHASLVNIKRLRNRVSHHEPAWRIAVPLTPAGVHSSLAPLVSEMEKMIDAISPDITQLLHNAGAIHKLRWLLDPQIIAAFAGQQTPGQLDLRKVTRTVRKIASTAKRAAGSTSPKPSKAVHVQHGGLTLMTVLPHA